MNEDRIVGVGDALRQFNSGESKGLSLRTFLTRTSLAVPLMLADMPRLFAAVGEHPQAIDDARGLIEKHGKESTLALLRLGVSRSSVVDILAFQNYAFGSDAGRNAYILQDLEKTEKGAPVLDSEEAPGMFIVLLARSGVGLDQPVAGVESITLRSLIEGAHDTFNHLKLKKLGVDSSYLPLAYQLVDPKTGSPLYDADSHWQANGKTSVRNFVLTMSREYTNNTFLGQNRGTVHDEGLLCLSMLSEFIQRNWGYNFKAPEHRSEFEQAKVLLLGLPGTTLGGGAQKISQILSEPGAFTDAIQKYREHATPENATALAGACMRLSYALVIATETNGYFVNRAPISTHVVASAKEGFENGVKMWFSPANGDARSAFVVEKNVAELYPRLLQGLLRGYVVLGRK